MQWPQKYDLYFNSTFDEEMDDGEINPVRHCHHIIVNVVNVNECETGTQF